MERNISWTKLEFPSRQIAAEEQPRLATLFVERFHWLGRPPGMALFAHASCEGSARPALYFSPVCRQLIADFLSIIGSTQCAPPKGSLILLAGEPTDNPPFFPETSEEMIELDGQAAASSADRHLGLSRAR
jgi:hypothetical protein